VQLPLSSSRTPIPGKQFSTLQICYQAEFDTGDIQTKRMLQMQELPVPQQSSMAGVRKVVFFLNSTLYFVDPMRLM